MILTFNWGIVGAAVATVIGNVVGAGCYLLCFPRGKSALSIRLGAFPVKEGLCKNVPAIGVPASLGSLLMGVSQIIVNARMADYGDMALAGMAGLVWAQPVADLLSAALVAALFRGISRKLIAAGGREKGDLACPCSA